MASQLNGKLDEVIEMIIAGKSFRQMADILQVPLSTLHDFTSKSEHSARVREALDYSADSFSDKAEAVLIEAESLPTEIQRARELAQHYRWKASKRSPKRFGDKVDITSAGKEIKTVTTVIGWGGKDITIQ